MTLDQINIILNSDFVLSEDNIKFYKNIYLPNYKSLFNKCIPYSHIYSVKSLSVEDCFSIAIGLINDKYIVELKTFKQFYRLIDIILIKGRNYGI